MQREPGGRQLKTTVLIVMAVIILIPSMLGFVTKFLEFIHTFQAEVGQNRCADQLQPVESG